MMRLVVFLLAVQSLFGVSTTDLRKARDAQDRDALTKMIQELSAAAEKKNSDAQAQYQLALAQSYLAEICLELRLKNEAKGAAEAGIKAAEKAVALQATTAEYHRILGTLCGQVIPANVIAGLKYGRCAMDSVNKAMQIDPKSSDVYLSHGVGNYYLPSSFGGGVELAIKDFQKALELNPKSADAMLWLGVAYRKTNANADARKALQKAVELNPSRAWAKQLLEKTPQ